MVAVTLTALIGFAGLGTDVVFALNRQRQMQAVASAAAFSGAVALAANGAEGVRLWLKPAVSLRRRALSTARAASPSR